MQPENLYNSTGVAAEALRIASREPMPLLRSPASSDTPGLLAKLLEGHSAEALFPDALSPDGALAGLWLRAGGWKQAHEIAQNLQTREGFYWHALVHRQEPDGFNAKYWFRQVGEHPIFPALNQAAQLYSQVLELPAEWKPGLFVDICVRPGNTAIAQAAAGLQETEWKLLFDFCAGSAT